MKFLPLVILISVVLGASAEPHTIRSALTGPSRIDGAHANQAIAVGIIPNDYLYGSDEIQRDPVVKWRRFIPINVWRYRAVAGVDHWCRVATFQFVLAERSPFLVTQVFVIPADKVKEFDSFAFEARPWYSIATSNSIPAGSLAVMPIDSGALLDPIDIGNIDCD